MDCYELLWIDMECSGISLEFTRNDQRPPRTRAQLVELLRLADKLERAGWPEPDGRLEHDDERMARAGQLVGQMAVQPVLRAVPPVRLAEQLAIQAHQHCARITISRMQAEEN